MRYVVTTTTTTTVAAESSSGATIIWYGRQIVWTSIIRLWYYLTACSGVNEMDPKRRYTVDTRELEACVGAGKQLSVPSNGRIGDQGADCRPTSKKR